jgi:hypothetical protein
MNSSRKKWVYLTVLLTISIGIIECLSYVNLDGTCKVTPQASTYDYQLNEIGNFSLNAFSDSLGFHIVGDYAYIVGSAHLIVLDISDPHHPTYLGNLTKSIGLYGDVYVSGNYACIAGAGSDFTIVNISDPTDPVELDQYYDDGLAWGIYAKDNLAFVASETDGVEIMNFTDPYNVNEIADFDDTYGLPYDVQLVGSHAYIADWNYGLEILDITDPTTPVQLAQVANSTSDKAWGIYVSDSYAYLADWNYGLRIFNVSDPENPVELWSSGSPITCEDVYVSGNYAFLVDRYSHYLHVYNVENKINAYLAGQFNIYEEAYDVEVHGNLVYVLGRHWLRVLDGTIIEHSYALSAPTSSTSYKVNDTLAITWTSMGNVSENVNIELYRFDRYLSSIELDTPNDGACSWLIPLELADSNRYQIKISDAQDESTIGISEYFEITQSSNPKIPGYDILLILGILAMGTCIIGYWLKHKRL